VIKIIGDDNNHFTVSRDFYSLLFFPSEIMTVFFPANLVTIWIVWNECNNRLFK